jgi:hypothetical protein
VRLVVQPDGEQAGDQALPQGRLSLAAGMVHAQRLASQSRAQGRGVAVIDQAERHGLVEPAAGQDFASRRLDPFPRAARRARERDRPIFGDVLVTVNPSDLFDQVDLTLQVAAP